jgi:hypothetical protein
MKFFFNNEETGESVDTSVEAVVGDVLTVFDNLPADRSSFLGLEDDSGKILQFAWEDENKWLVDIPDMKTRTARQKFATDSECLEIIREAFAGQPFEKISGLKTNSIK